MKQLLPITVRNGLKKYAWRWVYHKQFCRGAKTANENFQNKLEAGIYCRPWNLFTQAGEDGILLELFHRIGTTNKQFVDIGSNDGINSNCANLAFYHYWNGIFLDANKQALERGRYIYQQKLGPNSNRFRFVHALISIYNVENLLQTNGCLGEPDLLCIDLDGNDYHVWNAIQTIRPRVVITEVQIEKGNNPFIPEYQQEFEAYEQDTPKGASPASMTALATEKGYTLVAANEGSYNLFFVRNDCKGNLPQLQLKQIISE